MSSQLLSALDLASDDLTRTRMHTSFFVDCAAMGFGRGSAIQHRFDGTDNLINGRLKSLKRMYAPVKMRGEGGDLLKYLPDDISTVDASGDPNGAMHEHDQGNKPVHNYGNPVHA